MGLFSRTTKKEKLQRELRKIKKKEERARLKQELEDAKEKIAQIQAEKNAKKKTKQTITKTTRKTTRKTTKKEEKPETPALDTQDIPMPRPKLKNKYHKKKDKKKLLGWYYFNFKRTKVGRALFFNRNGTIKSYFVVPHMDQFQLGDQRYIFKVSQAYFDMTNRVYTCVYHEGNPLPINLVQHKDVLTFDTINSEAYAQVQKMDYIKTLAEPTSISKILKNVFMIVLIILIVVVLLAAVYIIKEGVIKIT